MAKRKLTKFQVLDIRYEARGGTPIVELAEQYEMSRRAMRLVITGETYQNVSSDNPECQPFTPRRRRNKVSFKKAETIREEYKLDGLTQIKLAAKYDTSLMNINNIVNNKTHLSPDEDKQKTKEKKIKKLEKKKEEKKSKDEKMKEVIIEMRKKGHKTQREFADELGVSRRVIRRLLEEIEEDS